MSEWQPIETAPKGQVIDIWCGKYNERLTDYRYVKVSAFNTFFDPVFSGRCCVRTATHWMPIPKPPM